MLQVEAYFHAMVDACDYHERMTRNNPRVSSIRFAEGDVVDVTEAQALILWQSLDGEREPLDPLG